MVGNIEAEDQGRYRWREKRKWMKIEDRLVGKMRKK